MMFDIGRHALVRAWQHNARWREEQRLIRLRALFKWERENPGKRAPDHIREFWDERHYNTPIDKIKCLTPFPAVSKPLTIQSRCSNRIDK